MSQSWQDPITVSLKGNAFSLWTSDHQTYLKGKPFVNNLILGSFHFVLNLNKSILLSILLFNLWLDMGCSRVWSLLRRCGILLYNNNDFTQTFRLQRRPICSAKKNLDFDSTSLRLYQQFRCRLIWYFWQNSAVRLDFAS